MSQSKSDLSRSLILVMAVSCGIVVANLYYVQPLLSEIAKTFHVSEVSTGTAAMLTQIGYAIGMFLFIPLGDVKEKRKLIITMLCFAAAALLLMSLSMNIYMVLFSSFIIGFSSIVPQLIVPFAAQLSKPEERGSVIGSVMSGLLIGILLSRSFSGLVGSILGWRIVYSIASVLMLVLAVLLSRLLPISLPTSKMGYSELLTSMWRIFKEEPVLREASLSGAMLFATFSVFWTTLVFFLSSPSYNLGAKTAGLFGLVGVVGALAAPVVGKIADKKSPRFTVGIAIGISTLSYIVFGTLGYKLLGLVIGVILLDLGTQSGQISNQARIYALSGEKRNRINTVFMVSYFIGGSLGTFSGTYAWSHWGWTGVCIVGISFQFIAIMSHIFHRNNINKNI